MTKRRRPDLPPPTGFVRALMREGWRREDAERIDVVRLALAHADDAKEVRAWAVRAAKALSSEPVRLGAIHRIATDDEARSAAFTLMMAAPEDGRLALIRLFDGISKALAAEREMERRYLESLEADELDEALD
jgi:hypothetical protein